TVQATGPNGARTMGTRIFEAPNRRSLAQTDRAQQENAMPDFLGLMKQAAELKSKMDAMQAELDSAEVEGSSGGGLVVVSLSGKGDMKGLRIDDTLVKPGEKEIMQDLIVAAHAEARRKVAALMEEKMKAVTGGLPLPPGLKLF